jgi:hypothetical protein
MEYITQVWNYALDYADCDFYPFLVKHHYRHALFIVQKIYDSSAVPQAYKRSIVKDMLRYPCGLRQILRMPVRVYCYHLLMWAASRLPIPHLGLKVFVVRAVNAVARRIFSIA